MENKCSNIECIDNATIYFKQSLDYDGNIYKLECQLNAPPEIVFEYVFPQKHNDMSFRLTWDKNLEMLEKIEIIDKDTFITRAYVKGGLMGLLSPREFVDVTKITKRDNVICFTSHSVTHDKCPLQNSNSYIRGFNYPCGIFCFSIPNEPNKTRMVKFIQADLGGRLHNSIIHAALPSNLANFYSNLNKALLQRFVMT
ncbi:unnamed protein product [Gordionus sp. m RMFG-2023]